MTQTQGRQCACSAIGEADGASAVDTGGIPLRGRHRRLENAVVGNARPRVILLLALAHGLVSLVKEVHAGAQVQLRRQLIGQLTGLQHVPPEICSRRH